jgi:hypothetical protein
MGIETLNAMNEGMHLSLLMMIKAIAMITLLVVIAGLAIYLAGITWFCLVVKRRTITRPRTPRRASPPSTWESAPHVSNT